jgi:hypothetical protein
VGVKQLKVGITVVGGQTDAVAALWSSGIGQNIVYLALLLQRLPEVESCALVACPGGTNHILSDLYGFPVVELRDAVGQLDVIIELGARAEPEPLNLMRARGGKLVSYVAGNAMTMNFEDIASGLPYGDHVTPNGFDAVWITPQHWHTNHAYAAITRSPNVEVAPHVWHPICLQQSTFKLKSPPFWRPRPNPAWRLGVFDPNVNVLKTFHYPLLVAEHAYRKDPDLIDRILLFSASHLTTDKHFNDFCQVTNLGKAGKVFAEGRFPIAEMLGAHIDAVVTHQWENNLNYLYWDVLYLGWPLIHNSAAFPEAGYYYPEFDAEAGGEVLHDALLTHAAEWTHRRPKVLDTLWRFNIDNPEVQRAYADLLEKLMSTAP